MSEGKRIMVYAAITALLCVVMYCIGRKGAVKLATIAPIEKVDTLFIHDTIVSEKPVFVEKRVCERVLVPVYDTIRQNDTLYVYADREQVHWKDTLSEVYASGIDVSVDSVLHFVPKMVITQERNVFVKQKCRWGIGVHAGYGAAVMADRVYVSPYIGVGLSYNIISW